MWFFAEHALLLIMASTKILNIFPEKAYVFDNCYNQSLSFVTRVVLLACSFPMRIKDFKGQQTCDSQECETWFPVGGAYWRCGRCDLSGEVRYLGQALRVPVLKPLSVCYVCFILVFQDGSASFLLQPVYLVPYCHASLP